MGENDKNYTINMTNSSKGHNHSEQKTYNFEYAVALRIFRRSETSVYVYSVMTSLYNMNILTMGINIMKNLNQELGS